MSTPLLSIDGLTKRFAGHAALSDVSLAVGEGEFVALLGPSGCGKTTLLRCIAGFLVPEVGTVRIGGEDVTRWPPYRRPLNTVFQNYALFPHMTVAQNVAYGPRRRGVGRRESSERTAAALDLVGLSALGGRYPRELSGGQQQRVALARAVVNEPKLLLLDEPLSALDLKLRKRVQVELKQLQVKLGIAFVFVTHDQEEAMAMADRIVVMNAGRVEQEGGSRDIYRSPSSRFVADFVGEANFLPLELRPSGRLAAPFGAGPAPGFARPDGPVIGVLRPEHLRIAGGGDEGEPAIVEAIVYVGGHASVRLVVSGFAMQARITDDEADKLAIGHPVRIFYHPEDLRIVRDAP